jgi:hypothetical protein
MSEPADKRMSGVMPVATARQMAADGLGADDIFARLKKFGLTYQAARIIVFGKSKEGKAS